MRRLLLAPSWIARHLLALGLVALFIRMGIWQLSKGESAQGTLQNLFYGVEWPIFAAFVLYWWFKMMKEELSPTDDGGPQWGANGRIAPETAWRPELGGPLMLTAGESSEPDEEVDAYNRYLAALYERDALREMTPRASPGQLEGARHAVVAGDPADARPRIEKADTPKQINGA
ncbi:hypothetical protein, partial [Frankia canadensis]|uniref:hypothetical protein n=1 Tax=Frankia canadensis TaxID=1836972 RepID=UPI001FAF8FA8